LTRSFNQQFDQHGAWRRNFAHRLKWLSRWLDENELLDQSVAERLRDLESQMRTSKVMVAFVAEFSRGKSELINAIFFSDAGRRVLPATPGRTTMCPVELGYDADEPPALALLPIETRLESLSLGELRNQPRAWTKRELTIDSPEQLAQALGEVMRTQRVSIDTARALGFWDDATPDDNPPIDAGLV